eukprot:CAMPEP_0118851530 /NCGR_PEP_ID=MMETSP1163-20130328/946_1 /TAXON_ID=124430 /ORGANISM="Phaeomonas parva, Strain CCMP2877" /LENGTH=63 /DNA_ID=CAMNT_0006783887 /DNA_START=406 /DNA_END=593 /DNA_ORIENTATION=+
MNLGKGSSVAVDMKYPQAPHDFGFEVHGDADTWHIVGATEADRADWVKHLAAVPFVAVRGSLS